MRYCTVLIRVKLRVTEGYIQALRRQVDDKMVLVL
jgi:hypothetical protein